MKYPKTIGGCVDQLYRMRADRIEAQRAVDALKKEEEALEAHILSQFTKAELNGAKGKVASAGVKVTRTVQTTDWDAFLAYVVKKKAWDMVQKRPSALAVKERWDGGEEVPGVAPFDRVDLSLTKVGG